MGDLLGYGAEGAGEGAAGVFVRMIGVKINGAAALFAVKNYFPDFDVCGAQRVEVAHWVSATV